MTYFRGPIWIDPRHFDQYRGERWGTRTITTTTAEPVPQPVSEDQIRKLIREEIADLPIKYDVPDMPAE